MSFLEGQIRVTNESITAQKKAENSQEIVWLDGYLQGKINPTDMKFVLSLVKLILENKIGCTVKTDLI